MIDANKMRQFSIKEYDFKKVDDKVEMTYDVYIGAIIWFETVNENKVPTVQHAFINTSTGQIRSNWYSSEDELISAFSEYTNVEIKEIV